MSTVFVHTLGDSTLDSVYWLLNQDGSNGAEAKDASVEGQLQAQLTRDLPGFTEVVSHAYDGFKTASVLYGDDVGKVLGIQPGPSNTGDKAAYLQNRKFDLKMRRFFVHPLGEFKQSVKKDPQAVHYVVLSVGGNDFREKLADPLAMIKEIPRVHTRYLQILNEVNSLKESGHDIRPILMFQYRLDARNDAYGIYAVLRIVGLVSRVINTLCFVGIAVSAMALMAGKINVWLGLAFCLIGSVALALSRRVIPLKVTTGMLTGQNVGMATLGGLLERFYRPILAQAKVDGIPILDLPNTFNPYDKLYISQIEPSAKGCELIAQGITHIVKKHEFSSAQSLIYARNVGQTKFTSSKNPGSSGWSVAYPQATL